MKALSLMLASLVLASLLSPASYNNKLSGSQVATADKEGIALHLTASGDLPGVSKVTLERDGLNVTNGTWRMTVLAQDADSKSSPRGELVGTITGGTLTLTAKGTLASASSVELVLQGGTGEFAKMSTGSGSGTINISANTVDPSQLNGTLVLKF